MNITVVGDRSFNIVVTVEFYDVKKLWKHLARSDEIKVKEVSHGTTASVQFTVVGRRPEEIKQITLEYDGHTVVLDPGPEEFRDLGPIVIYDKGRDFWTNVLREKAKGVNYVGG